VGCAFARIQTLRADGATIAAGVPVLKGGLALAVLLLAGCPGDPLPCGVVDDPDASAPSLVDDPFVGTHLKGTRSLIRR
jgi:hypothetical protein